MSAENVKVSGIGYRQIQEEGLENLKTGKDKNKNRNRNVCGEIQVDK